MSHMAEKSVKQQYTCTDYRAEMILLSLNRRLCNEPLSDEEKTAIKSEIKRIEQQMGMD